MSVQDVQELMQRVDALTTEEKLQLIAHLAAQCRIAYRGSGIRRKWREVHGVAPSPLTGEDAQAWVTRLRSESDEQRRVPREEGP